MSTTRRQPSPGTRRSRGRTFRVLLAAAVLLVVGGLIGYTMHGSSKPRAFTGTVTFINGPGDAGCIQPEKGGEKICTGFYNPDRISLAKDQRVVATKVSDNDGQGGTSTFLVVHKPHS